MCVTGTMPEHGPFPETLTFTTFAVIFMAVSFLLACLELFMKAKPSDKTDFESAYDLPPGTEKFERRDGKWVHKETGKPAAREEVESAGLIWEKKVYQPLTPPSSPKGRPKVE